jgi:hypothetical protein
MSQPHSPPADPSSASSASTPPQSTAAGGGRSPVPRWFLWLALAAMAGYAVFLSANMTAVAGGSDSSGYLNSARLFAAGKVRAELRVPPEFAAVPELQRSHFSPAGFNTFPVHDDLAPSYPSGLPLHLAVAGILFGWKFGPLLLQLAAAIGAVWLCYRAARELGLGYPLAAAGAAMLALFPVFLFTSIQTLSDTLATTWTLAALLCALRGRSSPRWAAACGAAMAIAVLVRPTNLLLAPGLVVLLGFDVRRLAAFVAGGVPGAIWLAWYNTHLYGGPMRSGYGDSFGGFGSEYGLPTALHFARWLALFLPAVMLLLPAVALARRDTRTRELLGVGLVAATNIGVYLFYSVSHEVWWCLRFILPGIAALILVGVMGAEALARGAGARWPRGFRAGLAALLTLWAAGNSWHWSRHLHLSLVPVYESAYEEAALLVRQHVPANAVVVCGAVSGALYYYTQLPTLICDSIVAEDFARYVAIARKTGRPVYAVVFDIEKEEVVSRRCPGAWSRIASAGNIGIWQLQ